MSILANLQKQQTQQPQAPRTQTPQMALDQQRESENTKWYAGDKPTLGETLKRIGGVYSTNQDEGRKLFSTFKQKMSDPSSEFYSPYLSATNTNTRNGFAAYGIDVSNVDDNWFTANAWMKQYNRTGATGNVLGTAKSATPEQNVASLYNLLWDEHQNTKKAKTELDAVLNAVSYWAGRDDLNLSDDEILAKIDWNQYPTLKKMDEAARAGAPMYTTSAVGYDKDLLYGAIYQARNNGGSGDLLLDSANYYGGSGNHYVKNDAVRAKMTYGSDTYNPYSVSGTINDIGLYFGQKSFDKAWLDANKDILNGNDETAKKNYHKVQAAVAFSDSVEAEMEALNEYIDGLVSHGMDANLISETVKNAIDNSDKYPSLGKMQESLETGKLLDTAYKSTYDMSAINQSINDKVKAKNATPEQNNVARGSDIVSKYGSEAEKAYFESMNDLAFDEQLENFWTAWNTNNAEGQSWLNNAYTELADSFNQKWAGDIDDTVEGYANYKKAVAAESKLIRDIETSDAFKRLRELGYTGEVNDYQAIRAFMDDPAKVSDEEYDALSDAMQTALSDLAQAEYDVSWFTENGIVGDEYAADYSALEAFRRRAAIEEDQSIVPLATNKEDYSFVDNAGLTADFMIGELMKGNAGLSGADAAKSLSDFYTKEKARLEADIAKAEKLGYDGKNVDNKKRKLAWYDRMLADIGRYNLQYQPDFAEKVEEGKAKVTVTPKDSEGYTILPTFTKDGNAIIAEEVFSRMTDSEKARFYYLAAVSPEDARAYIGELTDDTYGILTYRESTDASTKAKQFADAHPVLASVGTVLAAPLQMAGTAYAYAQGLQGKEISPYSAFMAPTSFISQSRAQVMEDIDKVTEGSPLLNFFAKAGYSAVTSGAESMLFGAFGKAGLPFMVGSGASATIQSAIERGADPTEALILGSMSALIEYGTEKIPFDALQGAMKGDAAAKETFKDWFVRTARDSIGTGMQDATGEAISEFAGNIVDQWLMGDRSNHAAAVEKWIADNGGLMAFESSEAAYAAAEKAVTNEELLDVASAFVSGFMSSAGSVAAAETGNRVANKDKGGAQGSVTDEVAVPESERDNELLRKQALIMSVTAKGGNDALAIANALKTSTDATLTIAKATALDMQKVFGKDTGKVLADILGAAHDAGVKSDDLINAFRSSLAEGNHYGQQALKDLAEGGATIKKVRAYLKHEGVVGAKYSQGQARGVLLGQYEQALMAEPSAYESLKSVTNEAKHAQDNYHQARFDVGLRTKEAEAAAASMQQAFEALNQAMLNPNANDRAAIQHAYFNAVDNVANAKSALNASKRRAIKAKNAYNEAMAKLDETNKNWMAKIRKEAADKLEADLQSAEQKSVDELKNATKPKGVTAKTKPVGGLTKAVNMDNVETGQQIDTATKRQENIDESAVDRIVSGEERFVEPDDPRNRNVMRVPGGSAEQAVTNNRRDQIEDAPADRIVSGEERYIEPDDPRNRDVARVSGENTEQAATNYRREQTEDESVSRIVRGEERYIEPDDPRNRNVERVSTEQTVPTTRTQTQAKKGITKAVNMDAVGADGVIDVEAIRAGVVDEMRDLGLLDELTDLNREITKLEKQIAGNRTNDKVRRPLDKMLKRKAEIHEGLMQTVESLVTEEVARIQAQQMQPIDAAKNLPMHDGMTRAVNKDSTETEQQQQQQQQTQQQQQQPSNTQKNLPMHDGMTRAVNKDSTETEQQTAGNTNTNEMVGENQQSAAMNADGTQNKTVAESTDSVVKDNDDGKVNEGAVKKNNEENKNGLPKQGNIDGVPPNNTMPMHDGMPRAVNMDEADIKRQQRQEKRQERQEQRQQRQQQQRQQPKKQIYKPTMPGEPTPPAPKPPEVPVISYEEAVKKYGTIKPGETPARYINMPQQTSDEQTVAKGFRTYGEAYTEEQVPMSQLQKAVMSGLPTYTKQTNAEQIQYAENVIKENGIPGAQAIWQNAIEGGRIPNGNEMALGAVLVDKYVKMGNTEASDRVAAEFAVAAVAAGQTAQATRIIKQLSGAGGVHYFNRVVNRLNAEYADSGRVITLNSDLVNKYAIAKTEEERERIAHEINKDLAKQLPFTLKDFANSLRYMSMLSSPKTSITNLAGNAANVPMAFAKDVAGAFLDKFREVDKRTHSAIINGDYLNYVKQRMAQEKQKSPEGSRYEVSVSDVKSLRNAFGNITLLNKAYGAVMKPLEWGDAKFKNLYYPRILAGYLQAKKVNLSNITQEMWEAADAYATKKTLELVYQDNNAIVKAVNELANKKYVGPIFSAILPFTKTPINIAKTALEYHPIGAAVSAIYQGKKNGWNSEQVVDAAAKGMAGALPVLLGFALRTAGILTTSLGDDPEDKLAKQRGSQAYALELGDKSFSISWMGPLSMLMNFGASIADACEGELSVDDLSHVGMGTLEVLTDLSLLSGVVDLFEISQYVQGDTPTERLVDYMAEAATQVGGNYVGQFVPAALGSVARTVDTTRRSTSTDPNSPIPESLQYQLYKLRNKIPGLSTKAPAYTNEFGQTETDSPARAFLENFIVPGYVNDLKKDDPVLNAVDEVYKATGNAGVIPKNATKSFSESGAKHKVSGDDYARMNTKRGRIIYDTMSAMLKSNVWKKADALIRAEMIQDVYNYADNASRVEYVSASPFSEKWQQNAYRSGNPSDAILGRVGEYAKSVYGELYAGELSDDAIGGDWESVANKWEHLTAEYPLGAGLSAKQAQTRIESELKTKLQEGNADVTPEEYEAVLKLFNLGMIDYTLVDELTSR